MFDSYFLAQLLSLVLLVVALTILCHGQFLQQVMDDVVKHPGLQLISGLLPLIAGAMLVLGHCVWSHDFRMLISLLGWAIFLSGVMRLLLVNRWVSCLKKCCVGAHFRILGLFWLLISAYLGYHGFHLGA